MHISSLSQKIHYFVFWRLLIQMNSKAVFACGSYIGGCKLKHSILRSRLTLEAWFELRSGEGLGSCSQGHRRGHPSKIMQHEWKWMYSLHEHSDVCVCVCRYDLIASDNEGQSLAYWKEKFDQTDRNQHVPLTSEVCPSYCWITSVAERDVIGGVNDYLLLKRQECREMKRRAKEQGGEVGGEERRRGEEVQGIRLPCV